MADLETVKIKNKAGGYSVINKEDYRAEVHGDVVADRASADILEKEMGGQYSSSTGDAGAPLGVVVNADTTPRIVTAENAVLVPVEGTTGSIAESSTDTAARTRPDLKVEDFNEDELGEKSNDELHKLAEKLNIKVEPRANKTALIKAIMGSREK